MPLSLGSRIGTYEILVPIGAGGMGEVYRARDTRLGRDVAIKVLPDAFANNSERLARFEREARVLAALNHPNIAAIYGIEERALVMELVEGETLADRLKQGPIPQEEALGIAKQIADALEAAHEQGIIHRDLKPANVKVTPAGVVKVLDFGLAKAAEESTPSGNPTNSPTLTISPTRAGMIMGTAAYMSPEQATGKPVDKRADIWSFGVVLWEMLTGKRLFDGETISHTLADVLRGPIDFEALPKGTPAPIRDLLTRCLDRNVKDRLRDVGEARVVIGRCLAERSGGTEVPLQAEALPARLPWFVAGALAFALGIAMWAPWRTHSEDLTVSQFVIPPPEKVSFSAALNSQAISPDGRLLVFVASSSGGTPLLWIRPIDSLTAHPLTGTDEATQPFWSPDSRSVGFFARGKLNRIDVAGGPAQTIADVSGPQGGSWNREGVILFARNTFDVLYRVSAGGGAATPITHLDPQQAAHSWPYFLPDGRHFLFLARAAPGNDSLYIGSLDSTEIKPVPGVTSAAMYSPPGYLLFLRQPTLMAQRFDAHRLSSSGDAFPIAEQVGGELRGAVGFTVSETGTLLYRSNVGTQTHLVWVDRAGKQITEVGPPGSYGNVALAPDGKRVAFDRTVNNTTDVWLMDLERRVTSRLTFLAQNKGPSNNGNVPVWSPDGRMVVFASGRTGLLDLYQRPSNMSAPDEVLLKLNAPPIVFPADWSSDGRYLAYYRRDPRTQLDLWVLPMFGDRKPFPFVQTDFNESQGQFSPDGKWMAYVSDESGTPQIYVQSFPTLSGKWQVSTEGGNQPRWRPDGKELFYVAADRKMMTVAVKTSGIFEPESPRALFETTLLAAPQRQTYAVSANGQRFLMNAPLNVASAPMTIIQNWTAGLTK